MKFIKPDDIRYCVTLGGFLPFAWLAPPRVWPIVARGVARVHVGLSGRHTPTTDSCIKQHTTRDPSQVGLGFRTNLYCELLEILRENAPYGWPAKIALEGREHIDQALEGGKGAILWFCPFIHADLVFKRGIAEAGYDLHHLSALTHGFSDTKFGLRFLNPLKTGVERRYLKERLVLDEKGEGPALRTLFKRLRGNGLVSITAVHTGLRVATRPFLGGSLRLATGAPNLAAKTGAALLPVFVVPEGPGYRVIVEPALEASAQDKKAKEEAFVSAYVPLLERYVRHYPTLWRGWFAGPNHWSPEPIETSEAAVGPDETRAQPDEASVATRRGEDGHGGRNAA